MLLSKLKQLCLQYLEQSDDTDILNTDLETLKEDDTFAEYLLNMDHSIYMGIVRFATSKILPLQEKELTTKTSYLTIDGTAKGMRLFHKVKEIYGLDEEGNILSNVPYIVIGNKIMLTKFSSLYKYYAVYYPTVHELSYYAEQQNIDVDNIELNDIDGNGLSVPDEMAINIKFLVYSDMKIEESADMANINKNYFESFLSEMSTNQVQNNQVEVITRDWADTQGEYEGMGDSITNPLDL